MFILEVDEEIKLRMLAARDAEALYKNIEMSRTYLSEWVPWVGETNSVEDSLSFIKDSFLVYAERKGMTAGIFYNKTFVGVISFTEFDWINKIGHLGYWLSEHYQGLGLMTRSVAALIDYSFENYDLNRIEIRAANDNKRSRGIPQRLGFKKEGHIRQAEWINNRFIDHIVYGMLRNDWTKSDV